jgi:hypothetical protein
VTHRFSPAGLSTACLALLLGSALLLAPLGADAADARRSSTAEFRKAAGEAAKTKARHAKSEPVKARQADSDKAKGKQAMPKQAKADKAKADKGKGDKSRLVRSEPEATGSIGTPDAAEQNCDKTRKRLWVEGEGWVVRRVTTCLLTQN